MLQYVSVLYYPVIFHSMDIPYLFICYQLEAYFSLGLLLTFVYRFLSDHMLSFFFAIYLQVKFLCYMVTLLLFFLRNYQTVYKASTQFRIPASSVQGFRFLNILANTCYYLSFFISHPSICELVSSRF